MSLEESVPKRFIGLDVHKHYLIAIGVDADLHPVLGPQRVELIHLDSWMAKSLRPTDEVVLEMTTNTWQLYEDLQPHVASITVVHPPHVALITRSQVMTDKIAASVLARLLAKGLLVGIWVPPKEVQQLRGLLAQREKMQRLTVQAKNRMHSLLHRHHILPPEGEPFQPELRAWWKQLELNPSEKTILQCDLDTLEFAQKQVTQITATLKSLAAQDDRVALLVHIPGINLITALTILAAVGPIARFPTPKKLVGYAGLGGRVHDSGMTTRTGGITKAGRKELRAALVEAAQSAVMKHPRWKAEFARLEPRLGRNKAIVAIARKLLVTAWYVLTRQVPDRFVQPALAARKLLQFSYVLGKANRPKGQKAAGYVRQQLDRLGIGAELKSIPWGEHKKPVPLPPSTLKENG
jgi:transposase